MKKLTLKLWRVSKGLSQEQCAKHVGVTTKTWHTWEQGTSYPKIDKVFKICKLFNCKIEDIDFLC